MQTRSLSRSWASPLLALALLLAACGGQSDTELATIDDGTERVGDDADAGGPDEPVEAIIETVERSEDDDTDVDLPVPEAVEPAPPSVESSPAARQANQAVGLPNFDEETGRFERLPVPEEDLDDASYLAQVAAAEELVESAAVGQQRITIPVTEQNAGDPAATSQSAGSQSSVAATPFIAAPDTASFGAGTIDPAVMDADLELGASGVLPDGEAFVAPVEVEETAPVVDPGPDPSTDIDPATDGAITDLGGIGQPAGSADGGGAPSGPGDDEPDCERRPWARGCPIPDDIFDRPVDGDGPGDSADGLDDGDDGDSGSSSEDGQADMPEANEGGVEVPQSVIDVLLTDPDDDPVPGAGAEDEDGDVDDDVDDVEGDMPAVVNPADG